MTKLTNRLSVLYSEYLGDEAWNQYVSNFPDINKALFTNMNLNTDIAKAIVWHTGTEYAEKWLTKKIPSLDDYRPIDVLKMSKGETILRSALMRMP